MKTGLQRRGVEGSSGQGEWAVLCLHGAAVGLQALCLIFAVSKLDIGKSNKSEMSLNTG